MTIGEQQIRLAARMYEYRDTSRRLLGERYPAVMAEYRDYIRAAMKKHGTGPLEAAKKLIELLQAECGGSEVQQMHIMSACVEMIEVESTPRSRLLQRRKTGGRHGR